VFARVANVGVIAAFLFTLLLPPTSSAQDISAQDTDPAHESTVVDEEVIVRGRRLGEIDFDLRLYIRDFIEQVAAPARSRGYARWRRSVCIGVHNLENAAAQYVVDRISAVALDVGLEPGEPGCEPQVNIIFAADGRQLAVGMVEAEPRLFRPVTGDAGMDLGLEALDAFTQSEKPVRWWHVSLPIAVHSGAAAIELPNSPCFSPPRCYPWVPVAGPSRVHSGIRDDLLYAIVIVDASALTGTTWQQIADYLSVVSLAQIDPWTNPRDFDSILNLFSNPAAYSGLTDWDRNYLHALYTFNQERVTRVQANEIVSRIARQELSSGD
jgi:hypothetical protein